MGPAALNPFAYSAPVAPPDLVDRLDEVEQLLALAEGGHFTRLSAPRRYGKTSVLHRVLDEAERRAGMNVTLVDLYGIVDAAGFAARLQASYRAFRGPAGRAMDGLLYAARLRAGAGGTGVEIEARRPDAVEPLIAELLELPARAHERTGRRCLVVFDEFQDLLRAGSDLDAVLRSHIQHHAAAASYVFAGSHPGLMSELFDGRERPLYGQARPIALGPLPSVELAEHVDGAFRAAGREAGAALGYLVEAAQGHPQRAMLLAHHLFEAVPPGGVGDEEAWSRAHAAAFAELSEPFARAWDSLDDAERKVASVVADPAAGSLFAEATLARLALARGSAGRARDRLIARGDVVVRDGAPRVVDPLWARWITAGRRTPAS